MVNITIYINVLKKQTIFVLKVHKVLDNWYGGGVATNSTKTQEYVDKIVNLRNQGVPIEGIGIMGYYGWITGKLPPDDTLREVFSILDSVGIPVYITELDISYDWMIPPLEDPNASFQDGDKTYETYWDYQA